MTIPVEVGTEFEQGRTDLGLQRYTTELLSDIQHEYGHLFLVKFLSHLCDRYEFYQQGYDHKQE